MNKKNFSKLILLMGGQPKYSGNNQTMYIHNIDEKNKEEILSIKRDIGTEFAIQFQ